jgi:hypothetical protein
MAKSHTQRSNAQALSGRQDKSSSLSAKSSLSVLEGIIDEFTVWGATGWAWVPSSPSDIVTIEARIGGRLVGQANADRMRSDIQASGRGTGLYGFLLPFDQPVSPGDSRVFTGIASDGSSAPIPCSRMSKAAGFVDELTWQSAVGWVWQPEAPHKPLTIEPVLDGVVLGRATADRYLEHLEKSGQIMGADEAQRPGITVAHDQGERRIAAAMSKHLAHIITDPQTFARMCKNAQAASKRFSASERASFYVEEFRRVCALSGRAQAEEEKSHV